MDHKSEISCKFTLAILIGNHFQDIRNSFQLKISNNFFKLLYCQNFDLRILNFDLCAIVLDPEYHL